MRPASNGTRPWRLGAAVVAVAIVFGGAVVFARWSGTAWLAPRGLSRPVMIGFLWGLLALQAAVVYLVAPASVMLAGLVYRARRRGEPSLKWARWLTLAVASLLGFGLLEAGSDAWYAWIHRYPDLPTRFDDDAAPPETAAGKKPLYFLVVGESSARGQPYDKWTSIGYMLGWKLAKVFRGRTIDVDLFAQKGAKLEHQHLMMAKLKRRPAAVLVYCGHNEFQSLFAWSRAVPYYRDESPVPGVLAGLKRLGGLTHLGRLISDAIETQRLDAAPERRVTRELVDVPAYTAAEAARMIADYRDRLDAIVAYFGKIGAVPILVVPAGNDAGFEPNRSMLPPETPRAEREAFTRRFRAARGDEKSDPARALAAYRVLIDQYPGFAETHFRLGRLLIRSGDWPEARRELALSRDLDGLPQRCPTPFQNAIREVAKKRNAVLIDGPALLSRIVPDGILDDRLLHDGQHPTLLAYIALTQEILDRLAARRSFGWLPDQAAPTIIPEECVEQFQISADRWKEALETTSKWYSDNAYIRHDPSERLKKAERLAQSARRIIEGTAPEKSGTPGLGCRPDLATPAFDEWPRMIPVKSQLTERMPSR